MAVMDAVKVPKMAKQTAKPASGKPDRKQYNVGVDLETSKRIDDTAEGLGLDGVNFLRMLIRENLAKYERRVAQIREGGSPE